MLGLTNPDQMRYCENHLRKVEKNGDEMRLMAKY